MQGFPKPHTATPAQDVCYPKYTNIEKRLYRTTYISEEELPDHAQDQTPPEYVQHQQNDENDVKKVISKKWRVMVMWIDPRAVNDPAIHTQSSYCTYRKLHILYDGLSSKK